jgi:LL-diaminopimelate aminotransferase
MDLQSLFAERIGGARFGTGNEIYKFEKIKRAKAAARQAHPGVELLDFGVGEPDQMAPAPVREALKRAVDDPANRGYADNGVAAFKQAAADYLQQVLRRDRHQPRDRDQPQHRVQIRRWPSCPCASSIRATS